MNAAPRSDDFQSANAGKFMLRLPDGLRERIKQIAKQRNRSMNAEIVEALETAYPLPVAARDFETIAQLMEYVEAAKSPADWRARLAEVNDRISRAPYDGAFRLVEIPAPRSETGVLCLTRV